MRSTSKAVAGAIVAGATALAASLADGAFTTLDAVVVAGAIGAGYLGVYVAPKNETRRRRRRRRDRRPPVAP